MTERLRQTFISIHGFSGRKRYIDLANLAAALNMPIYIADNKSRTKYLTDETIRILQGFDDRDWNSAYLQYRAKSRDPRTHMSRHGLSQIKDILANYNIDED